MTDLLSYSPIISTIHYQNFEIGILRLDLLHPQISGNKWFKLKYNIEQAKKVKKDTIITFGGAFSNHIAATAVGCKLSGLKSIGIIRGEELSVNNPTLKLAQDNGMELLFVSRVEYSQKDDPGYLHRLAMMYSNAFIVPEGGSNKFGQKGCEEILTNQTDLYTTIFCASGTGTTYKGIAASLNQLQKLIVVNVLKYELKETFYPSTILNNYHFGGYAKHTAELLEFKNWFESKYNIPLDYVYTAKLFYAVFNQMIKGNISSTEKILVVHTGGLQGNTGYENRYNLNPNRHVNDAQG